MNPQKFKRCYDQILEAEENAREKIETALKEKYIYYFIDIVFI